MVHNIFNIRFLDTLAESGVGSIYLKYSVKVVGYWGGLNKNGPCRLIELNFCLVTIE